MPKITKKEYTYKEDREQLWCKECERFLPRETFTREGTTPSGKAKYRSRCKKCYTMYAQKHYPSVQKQKALVEEVKVYINTLKTKCVVCGYDKCPSALELHHSDPSVKERALSDFTTYKLFYSLKLSVEEIKQQIDDEAKKCVVLCCRCHREHHAGMLDL